MLHSSQVASGFSRTMAAQRCKMVGQAGRYSTAEWSG